MDIFGKGRFISQSMVMGSQLLSISVGSLFPASLDSTLPKMVAIRVVIFVLVGFLLFHGVDPQVRRNTEPLNIGFIFSLPYDISNTLRAPLGGPLSLVLGAGLALIMFFGMLASPLYYIFGIPPRRYHIRDAEKNFTLDSDFFNRRSFDGGVHQGPISVEPEREAEIEMHPQFMESAFLLIPVEELQCQLLMICHAHGFLRWLPEYLLKFYKLFSRKISTVGEIQQEAVIIGFEDQDQCSKVFDQCSLDIVTIGKMTFNYIVTQIIN